MNKSIQHSLIILIISLAILSVACSKYEAPDYQEIKNRMQTTFVGTQTGDGLGSIHETEVNIFSAGDSTVMVVGLFYDSLIVKIISIDQSDGLVTAIGDSIDQFIYIDKDETLDIIKSINDYPLFTFNGKAKD